MYLDAVKEPVVQNIRKYLLKMVRFDILKYLMVIWDPMEVLGAKQGVIMSLWGPVGVIARSAGVSETQWGLCGGHWSSVGLIGCQGVSAQCIYTRINSRILEKPYFL